MDWNAWIVGGLVLLLVEAFTPGTFFFIFFAAAAVLTGLLTAFHCLPELWQQALVMTFLAIAGLVFFRRSLLRFATPRGQPKVDSMLHQSVTVTEAMEAGAPGKVEFRGTSWMAHNMGDKPIMLGEKCRIERVEGITLWVRSDKKGVD